MRPLKHLSLAAAAVLAVTTLAACGPGNETSPDQVASIGEVRSAFAALGDSDRLAVAVSADLSGKVAANILDDVDDSPGEVAAAHALLGSTFAFKVIAPDGAPLSKAGKGADPWATRAQLAVTTPGADAPVLDARFVDGSLYVGTDPDTLAEFGVDLDDIAGESSGVGVAELQALADSKFVSVDRESLEMLADAAGDEMGVTGLSADQDTSEVPQELVDVFTKSLDENASTAAGSDGYTTVTVDTPGFLADAYEGLRSTSYGPLMDLADSYGDGSEEEMDKLIDNAPELEFDVKIADGHVSDLRIDLTQFADDFDQMKMFLSGNDTADINIAFDTDFDIDAPSDAVSADELVAELAAWGGGYQASSDITATQAEAKQVVTAVAAYGQQNDLTAVQVLSDPVHRAAALEWMGDGAAVGPITPGTFYGVDSQQTVAVTRTSDEGRTSQCLLDVSGELPSLIENSCG